MLREVAATGSQGKLVAQVHEKLAGSYVENNEPAQLDFWKHQGKDR